MHPYSIDSDLRICMDAHGYVYKSAYMLWCTGVLVLLGNVLGSAQIKEFFYMYVMMLFNLLMIWHKKPTNLSSLLPYPRPNVDIFFGGCKNHELDFAIKNKSFKVA
jgi:hypothetical protein